MLSKCITATNSVLFVCIACFVSIKRFVASFVHSKTGAIVCCGADSLHSIRPKGDFRTEPEVEGVRRPAVPGAAKAF